MGTTNLLLVRLNISQWTARKFDKKTTAEVDEQHAALNAGRYNKILIAEAAIKAVSAKANAARTFHYFNTLPWHDDGARILTTANHARYCSAMHTLKNDFETAAAELINSYPDLREEARLRLNTLFNEADYPDVEKVKEKYSFSLSFDCIADAPDPRLDVSEDQLKVLAAEIEDRLTTTYKAAQADAWRRLFDTLSHFQAKTADPDAIFRDSTVKNLEELIDVLPALNFTNDPALNSAIQEVKTKIITYDPDSLRKEPLTRKIAAAEAQEILDIMSQYME